MKNFFAAALRWAREDLPTWLRDVAGWLSLIAIVRGIWMIYVPAAWIIGGLTAFALMMFKAWLASRKGAT